MPEVTTDPGQLDALAGEFVLGTLDSDERSQAQALIGSDPNFAAKVKLWERRLGELHLMVEPVEPDGKLWERIKEKVPQPPPSTELKPPASPALEPTPPPSTPEPAPAVDATPATPAVKSAQAGDQIPALPPAPTLPPKAEPSPTPTSLPPPPVAPALNRAAPQPAPAPPVPTPAAPRAPAVEAKREPADAAAVVGRRLGRWRAFAMLMTLVVIAIGVLLAAWRFAPERVPPVLQPVALMRLVGVQLSSGPPPRPPAPPESRYDE
jgi:anti-sigma-K factor RskA